MSDEPKSYRFWSGAEDTVLIEAWNEGKSFKEIAILLNKSELEPCGPAWTHSRLRTPDTVRMRVQTLRKHNINLPVRSAAFQRWRHKHTKKASASMDAVQNLIAANRVEKARMQALRDELKAAKEAQRVQMVWERLEREEKAAIANRKGWPVEGVLLFTDNLTKAELDRENMLDPGRIPFVGTAPFLAGRRAA